MLFVEVVAVGPFRRHLIEHYAYPAERYTETREGVATVTTLFGIAEGTSSGAKVAEALGISNVWDFNEHKINPAQIEFSLLEQTLKSLEGWPDYNSDLSALRAFAAEGYDLYLLPNG